MQGIGVPSKIYFSLAADRPILGVIDPQCELVQMLNENKGVGWSCDPDQPEKLAAKIDEICKFDLSLNLGKARALMERRYDEIQAMDQYIKTIHLVLNSHYPYD
jgi:hypothetical protein